MFDDGLGGLCRFLSFSGGTLPEAHQLHLDEVVGPEFVAPECLCRVDEVSIGRRGLLHRGQWFISYRLRGGAL